MNYEKSLQAITHTPKELKTITKMYSDHYNGLLFKMYACVKDRNIAEDLVADVFCKASQKIRLFDKNSADISTWLYSIANNHLIDYLRSIKNKKTVNVNGYTNDEGKESFDFLAPKSSNADSLINNKEIEDKIILAFENLKPNYKEVATLYFINEYSYNEIANILNIPLGSVKGMLNRAKIMLQDSLKVVKMA